QIPTREACDPKFDRTGGGILETTFAPCALDIELNWPTWVPTDCCHAIADVTKIERGGELAG
ncbi:unnamed protein product, partial [Ostreobium quekettii]